MKASEDYRMRFKQIVAEVLGDALDDAVEKVQAGEIPDWRDTQKLPLSLATFAEVDDENLMIELKLKITEEEKHKPVRCQMKGDFNDIVAKFSELASKLYTEDLSQWSPMDQEVSAVLELTDMFVDLGRRHNMSEYDTIRCAVGMMFTLALQGIKS